MMRKGEKLGICMEKESDDCLVETLQRTRKGEIPSVEVKVGKDPAWELQPAAT